MKHKFFDICLSLPIAVMVCGLVLLGSGCRATLAKPKTHASVHASKDIALNSEQVRLRLRAQVQSMSGIIVETADQILAATTNRLVRRQALLWKIEAVPALREALLQPQPLKAVADAWVLSWQMTDYFQTGPGQHGLGEASGIAVTACQRLENEVAEFAASITISHDVSNVRAVARKWAAEHPIRSSISGRESVLSDVAGNTVTASFSATEAIGNVSVSLDDLSGRLEIYSAQFLDQSQWQAELLVMDMAQDYELVQSAGRALAIVEKAPALIAGERQATLEQLHDDLTQALQFAQQERIAALEHVTSERIAALKELQEDIVQERQAMSRDMERIGVQVVDHAMWRLAQMICLALLMLLAIVVAGLLIVRRMFFRTPPTSGS